MAVTFSIPTNGTLGTNSDASSYSTGSVSLTNNALFIVFVYAADTAAITTPTLSSSGLDGETEIDSVQRQEGSLRMRITAFHALGNGTSAVVTANFSATMGSCAITVIECADAETGGTGGASAIIQSASATGTSSLGVTLSSFASANNGTLFGCGIATNVTPGGDGSLVDEHAGDVNNDKLGWVSCSLEGEDTTPSASWSGESEGGGCIGVEISEPLSTFQYMPLLDDRFNPLLRR